jgi:hypothetical protein
MCLTSSIESRLARLDNLLVAIGVSVTAIETARGDFDRSATGAVMFLASEAHEALKAIQADLQAQCEGGARDG